MTDPYQCLKCSTIVVGIYNILYCLVQYGILGWQVSVVKERQWEYENRQLPATGFTDGFQARFPGLYAIYTETPERRRINGEDFNSRLWSFGLFDRFRRHENSAMFAIVLICLCLCIIHLMTTVVMLLGVAKRNSSAILPFFFTGIPTVVMCTAYAVLWWSGDIFNEQLTMSVAEFVLSLAINGIGIAIVLIYYYRLTGQLTSDKPRECPPLHTNFQHYPNSAHRMDYEKGVVPPWRTEWEDQPSWTLEKKLRRRERLGTPARPILGFHRKEPLRQSLTRSMENLTTPQQPYQPVHQVEYNPELYRQQDRARALASLQQRSTSSPAQQQSVRNYDQSPRRRDLTQRRSRKSSKSKSRSSSKKRKLRPSDDPFQRKSSQRVSFNSKPKIYERTPESSVSEKPGILEVQTVV